MPHVLFEHVAVPFVAVQTYAAFVLPQPPQLFLSFVMLTSHPFDGSPSQSRKPELHETITHEPVVQEPVAFAGLHCVPHEPQFAFVRVEVSQPGMLLSQFA